jgi:diphthamide biosynthesis protein 2
VDEVAAQHVGADAMVHYGHACMSLYVSVSIIPRLFGLFWSRTSRLPVIYVFGNKTVDVDLCVKQLVEAFDVDITDGNDMQENAILLKHDVVFTHQAGISLSSYSLLGSRIDPRYRL